MSQLVGYIREKLQLTVHKIIFQRSVGEGKYVEVCQKYVNVRKNIFKLDKTHEYPFNPSEWKRQSKNRFLHYKDYDELTDYGFYPNLLVKKPSGRVVLAVELAAAKGAEVARAVAQGGQLQAGLLICVLCIVVGVFGGLLLGYFGLPLATGQHLVANAGVSP